jgi:carboxylesterase
MIKTGWEDWWASVEAGYYKLTEICNKIFVGGHSMGGSLALHLAAHHPEVAGVVSICAPAYLEGVKFKLLPIIKLFKKYVKKRPEMLAREEKYDKVYDKFPLPCVHSLYKFLAHLRDDLPKVIVPTIIFQAVNDELIPIQSAEYIYNHISAQYKTLIWLNHSYHSIDNKQDRTKLIKNTIKFIHTHS